MRFAGLLSGESAATGDVGAGTECQPGCEVAGGLPAGHVGADFGDELQNRVAADAVDLSEVDAEELEHTATSIELRLIALETFSPFCRGWQTGGLRHGIELG